MAEVVPQVSSWWDSVKHGIVNQIATAMAAPETVGPNIWSALKDFGNNLGGGQKSMDEMSAKELAEAVGMGFGTGTLGTIRVGGRPDLMMHHGSNPHALSYVNRRGETVLTPEIHHPSIAITQGPKLENQFSEGATLIPRVGAFDPAYSTSTLFNRDAYTPRAGDYPGASRVIEASSEAARARNRSRFELTPKVDSEGAYMWTDPNWKPPETHDPHGVAKQASPAFRSLAAFEGSKKGAETLGADYGNVSSWSRTFKGDYIRWAKENGIDPQASGWIDNLRILAGKGDKEAQRLLYSAQTAPSEYAELKVSGPVPLTGDRWAGVLLRPSETGGLDAIKQAFIDRGIRPESLTGNSALNWKLAQQLQEAAGAVPEQPLSGKAFVPPVKRQFFVTRKGTTGDNFGPEPELPMDEAWAGMDDPGISGITAEGVPKPAKAAPSQEEPMFNVDQSSHLVNADLALKAKNAHVAAKTLGAPKHFTWFLNDYTVAPNGNVTYDGAVATP